MDCAMPNSRATPMAATPADPATSWSPAATFLSAVALGMPMTSKNRAAGNCRTVARSFRRRPSTPARSISTRSRGLALRTLPTNPSTTDRERRAVFTLVPPEREVPGAAATEGDLGALGFRARAVLDADIGAPQLRRSIASNEDTGHELCDRAYRRSLQGRETFRGETSRAHAASGGGDSVPRPPWPGPVAARHRVVTPCRVTPPRNAPFPLLHRTGVRCNRR